MNPEGKYMYCIIECASPKSFGPIGIGGRGDELTTVSYRNLSAVVSHSPIIEHRVSRENTMAHQSAIETVMTEYPVLPVRFSTIAETQEEIIEKVLKPRYEEFLELLAWVGDKKELGLKIYWQEMKAILNEVVEADEAIKSFRDEIQKKSQNQIYYDQIEIGKMIEKALNEKREKEGEFLIKPLKELAEDTKVHTTYLPELIVSAAFLVKKTMEPQFDQAVNRIQEDFPGRHRINYIGEAPPVNFVNIVIKWDREAESLRASRSEAKQSQNSEIASATSGVPPRNDKET
jgi:hypothetical protein